MVVVLDEQTRQQLWRTARSVRAEARAVIRAKIVLAAADGTANAGIAVDLAIGVDMVRKWRGRFVACGLAGLADARRAGRPRSHGADVRVRVVAAATSVPFGPESTWSHRRIAEYLNQGLAGTTISPSQVGRILADCDVRARGRRSGRPSAAHG